MTRLAPLTSGFSALMLTLVRRHAWLLAVLAIACTLAPRTAGAVPVFARRYGTSCQTCHVVFPRLTPFGEAFRRNGYRFPDGQDEDFRRQEPQALGASAYRDLFPNAVWPGEIPSSIPVSIFMSSTAAYDRANPASVSFASLGGTVRLTAAAALGEHFSAWAGVNVAASTAATASVSLERAFLTIKPFDRPYLNFRIGRFEPGVFGFSMHRLPGPMPWIISTPVHDNQFMLEPTQLGVEATGVGARGRATYAVGYVQGAGNQLAIPRDFYGRLGFKIGGMRLDGVTSSGEVSIASPQPWREWSVQVGMFGYMGLASLGNTTVASQDDRFVVAGGDVNATFGDLLLIAAYSVGRNSRPSLADPTISPISHHWMVQLDYVIFPWLVPGVRVEQNFVDGQMRTRVIGQVYALVRANVRMSLTAILEQPAAGTMGFTALQATAALGF
ncbi:MAG: hypothetical protein WCJ30_00310 [Deltaproteobacteria bacterium]